MANKLFYKGQTLSDDTDDLFFGGYSIGRMWYRGQLIWDRVENRGVLDEIDGEPVRVKRITTFWDWARPKSIPNFVNPFVSKDVFLSYTSEMMKEGKYGISKFAAEWHTGSKGDWLSFSDDCFYDGLTIILIMNDTDDSGNFDVIMRSLDELKPTGSSNGDRTASAGTIVSDEFELPPGTYYALPGEKKNRSWNTYWFRQDQESWHKNSYLHTSKGIFKTEKRFSLKSDGLTYTVVTLEDPEDVYLTCDIAWCYIQDRGIKAGAEKSAKGYSYAKRTNPYDDAARAGMLSGGFRIKQTGELFEGQLLDDSRRADGYTIDPTTCYDPSTGQYLEIESFSYAPGSRSYDVTVKVDEETTKSIRIEYGEKELVVKVGKGSSKKEYTFEYIGIQRLS